MENKKQTAIEWLFEQFNNQDIPFGSHLFKEAKELEKQKMIDFAKYHVEKSLEQASNLATKFLYISIDSEDEDYYKKEILNAYNLENIK